ncbi:MAG: GAF domain-containing protein [Candidatus Promineifilaceae bacterium]
MSIDRDLLPGKVKSRGGKSVRLSDDPDGIRDNSDHIRPEEQLKQAYEVLEQRVAERTAELADTNVSLQEEISERKRVESSLEERNRILETLTTLSQQASLQTDSKAVLQTYLDVLGESLDATSAYISTWDREQKTVSAFIEYIGPHASEKEKVSDLGIIYSLDEDFGMSAESIQEMGEGPFISHINDPDLSAEERAHFEEYGNQTELAFPLTAQGQTVGMLAVWESRQKRTFTEEEINLVRLVAHQVAAIFDNNRLYQKMTQELQERRQAEKALQASEEQIRRSLERRSREIRLSAQVAQEIASAVDLNDLYKRIVTQVKEQFDFYHVQLLHYDPALDSVILIAGYGQVGLKMMAEGHRMPMGIGLIGAAAAMGVSYLQPDVTQDAQWEPNPLLPETKGELAVPIRLGSQVLGVLDVQSDQVNALTEDDQLALEGLCGQLAVAIESTTLREEMSGRLRELNKLQQLMSREGWKSFQARHETKTRGYFFDHSTVHPLTVDTQGNENNRVEEEEDSFKTSEFRHIISTPLTIRGEVIGTLAIQDEDDQPLSVEDRELIDAISVQVAEALESARLLEQTQKNAVDMETVAQVGAVASTILQTQELLQTVVTLTQERFGLYFVSVFAMDEEAGVLTRVSGAQLPIPPEEAAAVLPMIELDKEQSLIAIAGRTRAPVVVNDALNDPRFFPTAILPETRSEMVVPLIVGDELLGVLDLQSDIPNRFGEDDVRIHTTLATQIAVAWKNANLYAEQLETAKRLREVDRLKSEFMASMSHELRTPLNSIIGFSDVLLEGIDGSLTERMIEDVTLIRDSGRHLRELISEILDMSKIEAGMMELRYDEVNIRQIAREIIANARSLVLSKEIDIRLELDPKLDKIEADRTRLVQILLNLMSNAIKFTNSGMVKLMVQDVGENIWVAVEDTGIGIRQEDIPIIFEQFRQIDGSLTRKAGGTGLGMPISKSLVELHGGEMRVESRPGVGSVFSFTLPKKRPQTNKRPTGPLPNFNESDS